MPFEKKKEAKWYSKKDAFLKACNYCAYQERTKQEVREKLDEWGQYGDEAEEIICQLIEENFLNEERFAKAFAGGRFRLKKWGRVRITHELKQRGVSDYCIRQAMKEIPAADYQAVLYQLVEKKLATLEGQSPLVQKNKAAQYAVRKGYEMELVWKVVEDFGL